MKLPPTRSGAAVLEEMADGEAMRLVAGEVVIIEAGRRRSLGALEIVRVRTGLHGEYGERGAQDHFEEVPVIDGRPYRDGRSAGAVLAWGVPDLLTIRLEEGHDS